MRMKAITNTIETAREKLNARYLTSYEYNVERDANGKLYSVQIPVYKTGKQIISDKVKDTIHGIVFGIEDIISLFVAVIKVALIFAALCSPWIFEWLLTLI